MTRNNFRPSTESTELILQQLKKKSSPGFLEIIWPQYLCDSFKTRVDFEQF